MSRPRLDSPALLDAHSASDPAHRRRLELWYPSRACGPALERRVRAPMVDDDSRGWDLDPRFAGLVPHPHYPGQWLFRSRARWGSFDHPNPRLPGADDQLPRRRPRLSGLLVARWTA